MGHGADKFAILDDGTAAHTDVKKGTKEFRVFLQDLCVFTGKRQVFTHLTRDPKLDIDELSKKEIFKFSFLFDKF